MGSINQFADNTLQDEVDGILFKYRFPPSKAPTRLCLMLHGWTGDENSMWIFASRLPQNALLVAPRGLYPSPSGGYSWYPRDVKRWPNFEDFLEAGQAIVSLLNSPALVAAGRLPVSAVGFSQGAALAYSIAFSQAVEFQVLSGLSGFVPEGVEAGNGNKPLNGLPVFVAHGTKDKIVPVERARSGNRIMEQAGAQVTYCEDDVGHKLSAACFRGLQEFFKRH
ncbi:MAG: hypothetical protein IT316_11995 [Anaerolineales bacterium]|nr:hypothetical protein [Anaerolineales bacterium]